MNIDQMTYGELKQIAALFSSVQPQTSETKKTEHPFIGKFCIALCYEAGVHAGFVESIDGENVILSESVRLWQWKAADGITLSGVAQNGIKKENCKFDSVNPKIYLTGVCELIPCSDKSSKDIIENGKK